MLRFFISLPFFRNLRVGKSMPVSGSRKASPMEPGVKYVSRAQMERQNRNLLAIKSWRSGTRMYDGRTFRDWYDEELDLQEMRKMMLDGRDRKFMMPDGRKMSEWTRAEHDALCDLYDQVYKVFGRSKCFGHAPASFRKGSRWY
jgi:hypothetical protein